MKGPATMSQTGRDGTRGPPTRLRPLLLIGCAASMLAVGAIYLLIAQRGLGHDFARPDLSSYLGAARRLVHGEPLYPQIALGAYILGERDLYLYPPPVALLFVPALLLPADVATTVWGVALIALAIGVAVGLARGVQAERRLLAVALVLGAFPLHWELGWGNVSLVTLALSLGAYAMAGRGHAVGSAGLLAVATGLKLLVLPVFVTLAVGGRWSLLMRTAALLAVAIAASWPLVGAHWMDWARLASHLASGPTTTEYNIVPRALRSDAGRIVLVGTALATLAGCGLLLRTGRLPARLALAGALAAAPFLSPFAWYSYALFTLPILVLLILGDVPLWARAMGVAGWSLIQLQALDQATAFPSALLGTGLAVSAALALGSTAKVRAPPWPDH